MNEKVKSKKLCGWHVILTRTILAQCKTMWSLSEPMGAPHFCVSSGGCCPATEDGHSSCVARTVTPRAVTFMAGNGTVFGMVKQGQEDRLVLPVL
jgi:hypothetical protein